MTSKKLFLMKPRVKSFLDPKDNCAPGESPEEFAALITEYFDRYAPADFSEQFSVDMLIQDEWRLRRYRRIEGVLRGMPQSDKITGSLMTLQRLMASHRRSVKRTLARLERSQKARRKEFAKMECQPHVM
jgi:hypothetical protein